ncbi:MAG: RodZ domain-containing protein [Pseudomonadota bacterium]
MISFRSKPRSEEQPSEPRGFDDFELRLGDVMRGERATLGKSLLDVERELRIKAAYVAAIENSDPEAFDTPGFIPGYVRSYARYLKMDPDEAFESFCKESGFETASTMTGSASSATKPTGTPIARSNLRDDPLAAPRMPYLPQPEGVLTQVEPAAVGSIMVLLVLVGGLGFGGWSVFKEIQRVQFAPLENTPVVLSDLDPLQNAVTVQSNETDDGEENAWESAGLTTEAREERLDRLFTPDALDVPVLVARDAPISTLDPSKFGTLAPTLPQADRSTDDLEDATSEPERIASADFIGPALPQGGLPTPLVVETSPPNVKMVAVRAAWVRVQGPDGSVIFEGVMNAGETYDVPKTEEAPTVRIGESGSIYFAVGSTHYGPAGPRGQVTSGLSLDAQSVQDAFSLADLNEDQDLQRYVAELQAEGAETQ